MTSFKRAIIVAAAVLLLAPLEVNADAASQDALLATPGSARIDGSLSEWLSKFDTRGVSATCPGCTAQEKGADAVFTAAWNSSQLLLAIEVDDEEVDTDGGRRLFEHDSVELTIDCADQESSDSAFSHIVVTADGRVGKQFAFDPWGIQVAAARTLRGYLLEIAIDWDGLCKTTPAPGTKLDFNLVINDRDNERRSSQTFWHYSPNHFQRGAPAGEIWLDATPR